MQTATRSRKQGNLGANIAGLVVFVVMAFPVYWMINTAFKPASEIITSTPHFFPTDITFDGFARALDRPFFWSSVRNSLIVGFGAVILSLVIGFLAALAIARFRFYGRRAFGLTIFFVQMIPLNALVIPLYLLLEDAGMLDKLPGLIVVYLALTLPFTIWLLRGFVAGIPLELEEAAQMDGCTRMQAFYRVVLPLVAPGLVATALYSFIQAWNEFLIANVILSSEDKRTVSAWLLNFITLRGTDWAGLMAASTLVALPVVALFLVLNRRIASGLVAGAVKG